MSTYQAASGAGSKGISELEESLKDKSYKNEVFTHPLAFNVIPHIDKFQDNKYTKTVAKNFEKIDVFWNIDLEGFWGWFWEGFGRPKTLTFAFSSMFFRSNS